jgi:hypothetical protein
VAKRRVEALARPSGYFVGIDWGSDDGGAAVTVELRDGKMFVVDEQRIPPARPRRNGRPVIDVEARTVAPAPNALARRR